MRDSRTCGFSDEHRWSVVPLVCEPFLHPTPTIVGLFLCVPAGSPLPSLTFLSLSCYYLSSHLLSHEAWHSLLVATVMSCLLAFSLLTVSSEGKATSAILITCPAPSKCPKIHCERMNVERDEGFSRSGVMCLSSSLFLLQRLPCYCHASGILSKTFGSTDQEEDSPRT